MKTTTILSLFGAVFIALTVPLQMTELLDGFHTRQAVPDLDQPFRDAASGGQDLCENEVAMYRVIEI